MLDMVYPMPCFHLEQEKREKEEKERQTNAAVEAARKRHPLPRSILLQQEGPYEVRSRMALVVIMHSLT